LRTRKTDALAAVTRWAVSSGYLHMSDSNALILKFVSAPKSAVGAQL
jgi:hypothetical protein